MKSAKRRPRSVDLDRIYVEMKYLAHDLEEAAPLVALDLESLAARLAEMTKGPARKPLDAIPSARRVMLGRYDGNKQLTRLYRLFGARQRG